MIKLKLKIYGLSESQEGLIIDHLLAYKEIHKATFNRLYVELTLEIQGDLNVEEAFNLGVRVKNVIETLRTDEN